MIEKIGAALGAGLFFQFPQFYFQYLHEMKGHVAELRHQVALFEQAAHMSNKNLTEWIAKFVNSSDPDFVLQGKLLQGMVDRLVSFQQAEGVLETSSWLAKPFVFLRVADHEIARETLNHFQWGLSFSTEGLAYGCTGLILGYVFGMMLHGAFYKVKKGFI